MAVIQSIVDNGTQIELTIVSPVDNVDIHVELIDANGKTQESCLLRPTASINSFVLKDDNRSAYVGGTVSAKVTINAIGMPETVLLEEQSEPIAVQ